MIMLTDNSSESLDDVVVLGQQDVADFNAANILPQPDDVLTSIRTWLRPTEYAHDGSEYRKHLSSHLEGTGKWVLDAPIFKKWLDCEGDLEDHGILWIRGVPGAGKSVLAATLIKHLSQGGIPVPYFFFRHTIDANSRPEAAVRDWLAQLLEYSPPLEQELKSKLSAAVDDLTLVDLGRLIRLGLADVPRAYCVVDALDEMDQTRLEPFLRVLDDLAHVRPREIKVVMTSRPVSMIERTVRNLKILDIRLDEASVEPDVAAYLAHRLLESRIPAEAQSLSANLIVNKAQGLFLYAKLAMDAISHLDDKAAVEQALDGLPMNLSAMYDSMLQEHLRRTAVASELQELVLQCVTHAFRPLRLLEISDCIVATQSQHGQDAGKMKDLVRTVCGPLLEVLPDDTVRVVHHSLTEYLLGLTTTSRDRTTSPVNIEPGPTHWLMARLCISYLQAVGLDQVTITRSPIYDPWGDHIQKKVYTPFTNYAIQNWHMHAKRAANLGYDPGEMTDTLYQFLVQGSAENLEKLVMLAVIQDREDRSRGGQPTKQASALHLAISLQMHAFADNLLERYGDEIVNYNADIDYSPLVLAVSQGNSHMVRSLIRHGASINEHDSHGATPLHTAVGYRKKWRGNVEMVELLLEAGADPMRDLGEDKHVDDDCVGGRSLQPAAKYAFTEGDRKIAAAFVPYLSGARSANRALGWAFDNRRHPGVVAEVLRHPELDINARDGTERPFFPTTPLYKACMARDRILIRDLLAIGADPNVLHNGIGGGFGTDGSGFNVLHALAGPIPDYYYEEPKQGVSDEDTRECFQIVIAAGANLRQVSPKKTTPLHLARDAVAAQCLIEAGLDVNAEDAAGDTLLHLATRSDVLDALVRTIDVDVNRKSSLTGQTPLIRILDPSRGYSSSKYRLPIALKLCELGASAGPTDHQGRNALHYAARVDDLDLSEARLLWKTLVEAGADPNARDNEGETPLHFLGFKSWGFKFQKDHFSAFLEIASPELEVKDNKGRTPLFNILDKGDISEMLLQVLKAAGARFDVADLQGRTLLHATARHCQSDVAQLKFLVEQGVNPKQQDLEGNTLWHEAIPTYTSWRVSPQTFKGLTDIGADVSITNHRGQTPLHILCSFSQWTYFPGNWEKGDDPTLFDYIVQIAPSQVNATDNQGVTPLHIAATFSPHTVAQLLAAGGEVEAATSEGMTALHLAARSRQANIIGLVISWLQAEADQQRLSRLLEAKDIRSRTALYYACASGCFESVQLLIDAGASIDSVSYHGSPWEGCADFEYEQANADWSRWRDTNGPSKGESPAGGVLIADKLRPYREARTSYYQLAPIAFPVERIDEILDLLVTSSDASGRRFIDIAISSASERHFDYTTACLMRARKSLGITEPLNCHQEVLDCIKRRDAAEPDASRSNLSLFELLMRDRYHDAARDLLLEHPGQHLLTDDGSVHMNLLRLIQGGFASILDNVLTPHLMSELGASLRPQQSASRYHTVQKPGPEKISSEGVLAALLRVACDTDTPNMNVLRLLVDKKGINANSRVLNPSQSGRGDTAVHALVRHQPPQWWHTNQALPFVLSKEVDIDAWDYSGMTPLLLCLEKVGKPEFRLETVKILLEAGASPNVTDNRDRSPLALASEDESVVNLLLDHGATVSASALQGFIKAKNINMLRLMLSRPGVDPNMRKPGKEVPSQSFADGSFTSDRHDPDREDELYPLDYVICEVGRRDCELGGRMLEILLQHGASLTAKYERTTVAHRMIECKGSSHNQGYSQPSPLLMAALEYDTLDTESRDADGMTLLLCACRQGNVEAINKLLERGADARARDHKDRNALHHFITQNGAWSYDSSGSDEYIRRNELTVKHLVSLGHEMLHETDDNGRAPLHHALLKLCHAVEAAEMLVSAGADPCHPNTKTGDTPLHLLLGGEWLVDVSDDDVGVVSGKRKDLFDRILAMGADINVRNNAGETPAFNFFRKGTMTVSLPGDDEAAAKWKRTNILPDDAPYRRLHRTAAVKQESRLFDLFEQMGLDWGATCNSGKTLLHVVAADDSKGREHHHHYDSERRVARFNFLMSKRLDIMAEDTKHQTPLDIAAALGNEDVLEMFKKEDQRATSTTPAPSHHLVPVIQTGYDTDDDL